MKRRATRQEKVGVCGGMRRHRESCGGGERKEGLKNNDYSEDEERTHGDTGKGRQGVDVSGQNMTRSGSRKESDTM